jgi:hypothetical protein
MSSFDFEIVKHGEVSTKFKEKNIHTFKQACDHLKQLPFKRNEERENVLCVLNDGYGTCSTKHALLKQLAHEHGRDEVRLTLGIFMMTGAGTKQVAHILNRHAINGFPEAHNYLKVNGAIIDITGGFLAENSRYLHIREEIEIEPHQVSGFKIDFHKQYIDRWLEFHPQSGLTAEKVWAVREECIKHLCGK